MPISEVYNMDCMEYMSTCDDKYFDLAIVDPPYGIGNFQQSGGNYKNIEWNNNIPDEKYFNELKRISKERIIWGANYYNCFENGRAAIIWNKKNPHPSMSVCEIASVSFGKRVGYFEFEWQGYVVKMKEPHSFHPCQKPVQLYKWLLKNYAKPNDKILDTHLGSGSTRIACWDGGFDFYGTELDKEYFDASVKRFENFKAQGKLF